MPIDPKDLPEGVKPPVARKIDPQHRGPGLAPCWIWTGYVRPSRAVLRPLRPQPEPRSDRRTPGRPRTQETYVSTDKPTPKIYCEELGYSVPVHQYLYAKHMGGVSIRSLPRLRRCPNALCVQPLHVEPAGPQKPRIRPNLPQDLPGSPRTPEDAHQAQILEKLCQANPSPDYGPEMAAEEAECDLPSPQTWEAYKKWEKEVGQFLEVPD